MRSIFYESLHYHSQYDVWRKQVAAWIKEIRIFMTTVISIFQFEEKLNSLFPNVIKSYQFLSRYIPTYNEFPARYLNTSCHKKF